MIAYVDAAASSATYVAAFLFAYEQLKQYKVIARACVCVCVCVYARVYLCA